MADIQLRSHQQILGQMISKLLAETDVNDLSPGSIFITILEAASGSDFTQEGKLLQLLNLRNVDKAKGVDLENLATEMGVSPPRVGASPSSVMITIKDSDFNKISTTVFVGATAPTVGDTTLKITDGSLFDASGTVYVGRGTSSSEPVVYTSLVNSGSYWTLNLSSPLAKDHLVGEEVVLAQGGDRNVFSGTTVRVPASGGNPAIEYATTYDTVLLDGEDTKNGITVIATEPGTRGNVGLNRIIEFSSPPFPSAIVINDQFPATGGTDSETDTELRQRIKDHVHNLAKGTPRAIISAVVGTSDPDENKRVVTAFLREPVETGRLGILFIDDGSGFQPSFAGIGEEIIVTSAAGTEQFFQLQQFPVVKAQTASIGVEPFSVLGGERLLIEVDGQTEERAIPGTNYRSSGVVMAQEIVESINSVFTTIEARAKEGQIFLTPTADDADYIKVGTASTDNINYWLRFPTRKQYTLRLYRNDVLLEKNGSYAQIQSFVNTNWPPFAGSETLQMEIDTILTPVVTITDADFAALTNSSSISGASPYDWATVLNTKFIGLTATGKDDGTFVLVSNKGKTDLAKIKIISGSLAGTLIAANAESTGVSPEYKLNRFLGQIETSARLSSGDELKAGSVRTYGFVETSAQTVFDLSATLGTAAKLVMTTDYPIELVTFAQVLNPLVFTNPATATLRITGSTGQFSEVKIDDYCYTYNLPRNGLLKVKAIDTVNYSYVDLFDPDPSTGTDTPNITTKQITFFRTIGLPQEVVLPIGASVTNSAIVSSINSQVSGVLSEILDNDKIRIQTIRYLSEGALGLACVCGKATNLGLLAGNYDSNDPHTAAMESADLAGLPSGRLVVSTPDNVAPYDDLQVVGTPFVTENNNRPLIQYVGASENLIRQPLELLTTSQMTLRNNPPNPVTGIGYDMKSTTTSGMEFGEADNMVFIIDDDAAKKTFDMPMYVDGTIAGPSVPSTTQFDVLDTNGSLLGSSARWLGYPFEDYRCWFQSKNLLPASVLNTQIKAISNYFGPNGKNLWVGIFNQSQPTTDSEVTYSIDNLNKKILISVMLGSGTERTIGLNPNEQVKISYSGVLGNYLYKIQFITPVDLSTVQLGDIVSVLDSIFSAANYGTFRVSAITNLSDLGRSFSFPTEDLLESIVSTSTSVSLNVAPVLGTHAGDKLRATAIRKQIVDVQNSINSTVTGFAATTIDVVPGTDFASGGGQITINAVVFTYTAYNGITGQFSGVTPDPTTSGISIGQGCIQSIPPFIRVFTGGAYNSGPGTFTVNTIPYTYVSYNSGTGIFDDLYPDPIANGVVGGDWVIQDITPVEKNIITVTTPTDVIVDGGGFTNGSGWMMTIKHKEIEADAPPSFLIASGDKIRVAGNIINVTGILSTTLYTVDSTFAFTGIQAGTISRLILEGVRSTAGVNETKIVASSQGIRVFEQGASNTANDIIDIVNNTAGIKDLITFSNATGSDGTGTINTTTEEELLNGELRIQLENGESFVYSTGSGSPAITLKVPADLVPEIGDKIKLIPMTPQNIKDHFNKKQISGLSNAVTCDLVDGARRLQVASKISGGEGQVFAVGGKASGNNVLSVRNAGLTISSTIGLIETDRSALDLLAPGQTIRVYQTGLSKKNYIEVPTTTTSAEIQIYAPGYGRFIFGKKLATTFSWTHTGTVIWTVRKLSRGRMRYEILSGTVTFPVSLKADDWVLVGNGESYAGITPSTVFASSNQGYFQVRETDNSTYFDVDNEGFEQIVTATSAPFVFFDYHSARKGDKIQIGTGSPFVTDNKGTFEITHIISEYIVYYQNSLVSAEGPFLLGTDGVDSIRIVDQGFTSYRKVELIAPNPIDPTNRSILIVSGGTDINLFTESQGAKIGLPNRLGFAVDPVPGMAGYQYWTGLKRRVQRVIDGYGPDPINFPGTKAAGVFIEAREPQIQRVNLNIKVKTKEGIALTSIADTIKSNVVGFINSLGLGQDVVLSEIVSIIQAVQGIDAVVLVIPTLDTERIIIGDMSVPRTSASEVFLS